ncbi:uncharacterized protein N7515_002071 [Penicillium bovifimosum]|uniref:Cdc24/Scd1 N-terminal domain-containing protein n=1 Tax=Penicillium bovifimosum TaxID=126998 RepID=A0A9W9HB70_9EURO|nr:uncharacterized protein N7515_002071 [Penicillium bovifimosum]KAJ5143284.1 hypothetical protein N7515_002071 [Penicillium bovifimosum]
MLLDSRHLDLNEAKLPKASNFKLLQAFLQDLAFPQQDCLLITDLYRWRAHNLAPNVEPPSDDYHWSAVERMSRVQSPSSLMENSLRADECLWESIAASGK